MRNKLDRQTLYDMFWPYLGMNEKMNGKTIYLEKEIDDVFATFIKQTSQLADFSKEDIALVRGQIKSNISIDASEGSYISNNKVDPWVKAKKGELSWDYWNAYKNYLETNDIPRKSIMELDKDIDSILDLSGDPQRDAEAWNIRGLAMGNVQSGKTQNFVGVINKAVDAGYKIIILIGSINDEGLRMQTQKRIDEGFTGFDTSDELKKTIVGVGNDPLRRDKKKVISFTSSALRGDFKKQRAESLSQEIGVYKDDIPIILVVKKNASVLKRIYDWFREHHSLDPANGKKLNHPLLFIDDEADWASPNTKKDDDNPTKINENIRQILTLFNKSAYIAYTATPFANIFINHENHNDVFKDDLFPKDFMIKLSLSEAYKGQRFYFPSTEDYGEIPRKFNPIINIPEEATEACKPKTRKVDAHDRNRYRLDQETLGEYVVPSIQEAVRCFIINQAIKNKRALDTKDQSIKKDTYRKQHNTMLVNLAYFKILIDDLAELIDEYLDDLKKMLQNSVKLESRLRSKSNVINDFEETFNLHYSHVKEDFIDLLEELNYALQKTEVRAIHSGKEGQDLNYVDYKTNGLCVIAIGGHRLSRGLTLENLSVSYFIRNSKGSDTLTQMCRWFGYRPGYEDLCKVFMTEEYEEHYQEISSIIDELYEELKLMKIQNKTPQDFGLKVREHPGNILITAKNKMRNAATSKVKLDLWGGASKHYYMDNDDSINTKNLQTTDKFIANLLEKSNHEVKKGGIIIPDVNYDEILKFISDMKLSPQLSTPIQAVSGFINLMKKNKISLFKVVVTNIRKTRDPIFENYNISQEQIQKYRNNASVKLGDFNFTCQYRNLANKNNLIAPKNAEIAGKSDEKILYTDSEHKVLEKELSLKDSDNNNQYYRSNMYRDYPALFIYPLTVGIASKNNLENRILEVPFTNPTIMFRISYPSLEYIKKTKNEIKYLRDEGAVSYAFNTVAQQYDLMFPDELEEEL
jgi:hypothetical protein